MAEALAAEYRPRDEEEHHREGTWRQTDQAELQTYGLVRT